MKIVSNTQMFRMQKFFKTCYMSPEEYYKNVQFQQFYTYLTNFQEQNQVIVVKSLHIQHADDQSKSSMERCYFLVLY